MEILGKLIILLLFCYRHEPSSHESSVTDLGKQPLPVVTAQVNPPLQLVTSIEGQHYCRSAASKKISMRMKLRLHYTNIAEKPVILYKSSFGIARFMISHSLEDLVAGRFEANASQTIVTEGKPLHVDDLLPGKFFTVISPNDFFEVETDLYLEVRQDGDSNYPFSVLAMGKHYLQIKVTTWPEADGSVAILRDRWKDVGVLWSDTITSMPMPFTIEKQRKVARCK